MTKLKYNGIVVPEEINPKYIFSGFANPVDWGKIEKYKEDMLETYDFEYTFPPIKGYPIIIDEDLIEEYNGEFINGELIENEDIGELAWVVTDGHHRSIASFEATKKYIDVELDRACITDPEELDEYDNLIS